MPDLREQILLAKHEGKELFYNSSGNKRAYQLGVKHLSSAEYLGFADTLPNKSIRVKKPFLLVDFENGKIVEIKKDTLLFPLALAT
ncbi:MAG: hypothetical protein IBX43_00400 [Campylobacterales bacterium]|nr:hypothetical protein [Campylobacterales bacterium]